MAHFQIKTQAQAKARIARDAQNFLMQINHDTGVFFSTWRIYEDLPLEKFQDAIPNEDRMLLPGMEPSVDIPNIAIQALGSVWHQILNTSQFMDQTQFSTLVHREALKAGAPRDLAKQLSSFMSDQYVRNHDNDWI